MAAPRRPDPIANEMAADLTADIEEAEAEAAPRRRAWRQRLRPRDLPHPGRSVRCHQPRARRICAAALANLAVTAAAFFALLTLVPLSFS